MSLFPSVMKVYIPGESDNWRMKSRNLTKTIYKMNLLEKLKSELKERLFKKMNNVLLDAIPDCLVLLSLDIQLSFLQHVEPGLNLLFQDDRP